MIKKKIFYKREKNHYKLFNLIINVDKSMLNKSILENLLLYVLHMKITSDWENMLNLA